MLLAEVRRRVTAWRQPRPAARIARALWITWAIVVWNVVFDHEIVVAGRSYIAAAARAAATAGPFANMDEWMRPAVTRGFWIATAAASAIVLLGLAAARSAEAFALRTSADPALQTSEDPALRRSEDPALRTSADPALRTDEDSRLREKSR